ncbi:hypothetical protein psyc5s11_26750 [Clostridium gelidum]|uniref:Uncharacterized protein n=1 Tax=Clostridium gelidum TaxID=704125 RepID=A0ABM7TC06_9CLOT|nr:hypothetical protein [Clostridium gelidum]BCZ46608.1 hypothetical protein psyc5s11_26750 [Clostridium gelidum]
MNNESKKNSILENSSQITSQENKKGKDLSTSFVDNNERKNEGNNDWTSVPRTYDKEESCHKHEKTATNNQWCSTNK